MGGRVGEKGVKYRIQGCSMEGQVQGRAHVCIPGGRAVAEPAASLR